MQMASAVQPGRRRGSNKSEPTEEAITIIQPSDLRQVTVLSNAEWRRIQDRPSRLKNEEEHMREAAEQREALHRQSKEVVKLWSNTITGQMQKKLEAKKIREQIEEEKRKLMDIEEGKYKEQKRKEIIERAKTQLYYQTDRVKGLHRALLLTEVLKERDAQVELKQRQKSATKDVDKEYMEMVKRREEEALRQEQEKAKQKKLERQAAEEDLKSQMKENKKAREQQKMEDKKDKEEIQRLLEQYQLEQIMESERQANERRNLMLAQMVGSHQHKPSSICIFLVDHSKFLERSVHLQEQRHNRDLLRAINAQKQEAEEEQRKLFLSTKQKMIKKEKELFREAQTRRERIMDKLTVKQKEEVVSEEQRIAKAVAERDAKQAQEQQEKEEKKAEMLKSIAAHRESMRQDKEQREKTAKQNKQERLQIIKEEDRIFSEKQQLEAKKTRENEIKLQDFNITLMAEKSARQQRLKEEEREFLVKNAGFMAEEENKFQQYSQSVINAAAMAQKNLFPLCKAAREGIGGGQGPVFGGVRPSYLVQDRTGAQMPKYVSSTTEDIKKRNEVVDIQEAKRRLGFTW
ncbi:cilia- and flagella- associated protein 210 isoform X1 [Acanthochromis polyacanthus]|uniref:cilia- and flagella- associated protein 210 isoform X1 n=1 Tax=Acanthochromis polyacanthus TaxID=80966 RepID=UPI000B8FC322|nr:cilia- and flagella- associated protein 210 isoform X1 [Acanthochromis polyacanthus]